MLFNDFDKDEKCSNCGKRLADLASLAETCIPCMDQAALELARASPFQHFLRGLYCLWSFDFVGMSMEFVWAAQRLTGTGEYGENGEFTKILKQASRKRP